MAGIYEQRLAQDRRWALREGSIYFEGRGCVQETLLNVTQRLKALGIDYAVAGGMAVFAHGLRRFTEDVDILVTREGLQAIHTYLAGRGYVPLFSGSKNLRDAEHGVQMKFLVAGEYAGDGKEKPIAFPEPQNVAVEYDGIHYLNLPTLIELKLASGMTNLGRLKDLADVQQLIQILGLPLTFSESLAPYVQEKYQEIWHATNAATN